MSSIAETWAAFLAKVIYYTKVGGALLLLVGLIAVVGAALAYTGPGTHFTSDGVALANTSGGDSVSVYYSVQYDRNADLDTAERKAAMDNVHRAGICANTAIDNYIETHTRQGVENADWSEVVGHCQSKYINVSIIRQS